MPWNATLQQRIVLAVTLLSLSVCALSSALRAHLAIPDDVYFYLKIADALYRGEGSTFNGLQPTNGYHPLWMLVCVLERSVIGPDSHARLVGHLAVTGALSVVATAMAWSLSGRLMAARVGLGAALFGAFLCRNHLGSELHASAPLLVASVGWALRLQRREPRSVDDIVFGALLGLTTLARLDNVFVGVALGLTAVIPSPGDPWRTQLKRGVRIAGTAAVLLLPYLAWNVVVFDHLVPISGAIKAGLGRLRPETFASLGAQGTLLVAGSVASVVYWLVAPPSSTRRTMLGLVCGAAAHACYTAVFAHAVWTWYFAGEALAVALTLEAALLRLTSLARASWRPWGQRSLTAAAALVAMGTAYQVLSRPPHDPWYLEVAAAIDREVPQGSGIAVAQSPGSLAYFSHRPIVALDGLTGDFAWHDRVEAEGLYVALRNLGVTHLLAIGPTSKEVGERIRYTRQHGHGGEGPAFEGELLPDGRGQLQRVGLLDPLVGEQVGWLRADTSNLRAPIHAARPFGLWQLAPADPAGPGQ